MAKKGYEGRIKNTGSQEVKAPYPQSGSSGGTVKKGGDLRTGGGKGK